MTKRKYPKGFYVYQLVDPRNGLPFYVGKGQRDRAWQHERQVRSRISGSNTRKRDAIRAILIAGERVQVRIVAQYEREIDAYEHEWRLVDASPTLTNIMPGGGASPAAVERRQRVRDRVRAETVERDRQRVRRKMLWAARLPQHTAQIEGWLHEQEYPAPPSRPNVDGKPMTCGKGRTRRRTHAKLALRRWERAQAQT